MNKNLRDFLLGISAGASIALGGFLNVIAKTYLGDFGKIVGSLLFPIGLTLVCYLGFNLYTGKIGYLLDKENKKEYSLFLLLVYLGNIFGAVGFGLIVSFIPNFQNVYSSIATSKASIINSTLSIFKGFINSILCGCLVYLAVYFYKTCKHHVIKVIGIFIPIAAFVYFGFDHCVANMFYLASAKGFSNFNLYINILIATVGNSFGGILLNKLAKIKY